MSITEIEKRTLKDCLEHLIPMVKDWGLSADVLVIAGADGGQIRSAFIDDAHPKGGNVINQQLPPGTHILISLGGVGIENRGVTPIKVV